MGNIFDLMEKYIITLRYDLTREGFEASLELNNNSILSEFSADAEKAVQTLVNAYAFKSKKDLEKYLKDEAYRDTLAVFEIEDITP